MCIKILYYAWKFWFWMKNTHYRSTHTIIGWPIEDFLNYRSTHRVYRSTPILLWYVDTWPLTGRLIASIGRHMAHTSQPIEQKYWRVTIVFIPFVFLLLSIGHMHINTIYISFSSKVSRVSKTYINPGFQSISSSSIQSTHTYNQTKHNYFLIECHLDWDW